MVSFIVDLLIKISEILNIVGVAIIVLGLGYSLYHFFAEFTWKKSPHHNWNLAKLRIEIGSSIVLGMDFMVSADVITSIILPGYWEIGQLAILVTIRIILSYFLNQELQALTDHKHT